MPRFGTLLTAMVTPFDAAGVLDVDAAVKLAKFLVDQGNDGLVLAGTTGESPTLTDDEKRALWSAVAEAVSVPVVAGTSTYDTAHSVHLTKVAVESGAAGILAVTPYYSRPDQAGIAAHFTAIAEAAGDLPVMLYDIPIRSGRRIAHETTLRLVDELPNVLAVKDATGDPQGAARLVAAAPDRFELYSGDDGLTLPFLAVGGVGLVSVAAHWAAPQLSEMISAFLKGDLARAIALNARLLDSFAMMNTEVTPNPMPAKAFMRVLGHAVGECRLPLGPSPAGLDDHARRILADLAK